MDLHETSSSGLRDRQVAREQAAREAALGRRAEAVANGDLGPVLARWIGRAVVPVADRIRGCANGAPAAELLGSDLFGLPTGDPSTSRDMLPVLRWCLKGSSPTRPGGTHAEDLVLAVLGTAMLLLATSEEKGVGLSRVLGDCGGAARETTLGQFITQVQGAKAMMRVRKGGKAGWAQGKQLDAVAALLAGQVRSALGEPGLGSAPTKPTSTSAGTQRSKVAVEVVTPTGNARRLDLRPPSSEDWSLLNVARQVSGEADKHDGTWRSFAMMVLCAAQAEAGLFQMAKAPVKGRGGGGKRWRHLLCLSEELGEAIREDLDRWVRLGFTQEPMLCEPENGDYLTVKHRPIAGRRGPMGIRTEAEGTAAWEVAQSVMAGSAWEISKETLAFLKSEDGRCLARKSELNAVRLDVILGEASRLAAENTPFYFPIQMDFRGRVYLRPQLVTYQGSDVQKGLLKFPGTATWRDETPEAYAAWCDHAANLYGHGAEKSPLGRERQAWWADISAGEGPADLAMEAEDPIQLYNAMISRGSTTCQIDGTCNGLQHLTALFRDDYAAPHVNLIGGQHQKADVYATVAATVAQRLALLEAPWARRVRAAIKVDRKLTKKSVMVLPYGGTRGTIDEMTLEAASERLEAEPFAAGFYKACPWRECLMPIAEIHDEVQWDRDPEAVAGNYLAFKDRDLKNHPLFRLDCQRLGGLIWAAIEETLPKAMQAMQTFRTIAKAVGDRTLEWSTGFEFTGEPFGTPWHSVRYPALKVIQAKARSDTQGLRLKGFQLPGSVRGLAMKVGRDEVDPRSHVSGIVANLIHSMDASHLARTMEAFQYGQPRKAFGAIHDCFITRPSMMEDLAFHTRETFAEMYRADPLNHEVCLGELAASGKQERYPSWYALAEACGTAFPEPGAWEPDEVLGSQWFFS